MFQFKVEWMEGMTQACKYSLPVRIATTARCQHVRDAPWILHYTVQRIIVYTGPERLVLYNSTIYWLVYTAGVRTQVGKDKQTPEPAVSSVQQVFTRLCTLMVLQHYNAFNLASRKVWVLAKKLGFLFILSHPRSLVLSIDKVIGPRSPKISCLMGKGKRGGGEDIPVA